MKIIGIIVEYNPFHNGHLYHLKQIKKIYPDCIIVAAITNYFTMRGDISIIDKETKTNLALHYGIDLVVDIPVFFGTQSADYFATYAIKILNLLKVDTIVFGSECNDINFLRKCALKQLKKSNKKAPEKCFASLNNDTKNPNDILGISYIKAIISTNSTISAISIKRTNDYHDKKSNSTIIGAQNIRNKILRNENIDKFIPKKYTYYKINYKKFFALLKYKILSDDDLSKYFMVDEGLDRRILKIIDQVKSIDELIKKVKSKRYSYLRIQRMFTHILLGLTKDNRIKGAEEDFVQILGFNSLGQRHLKNLNLKTKIKRNDSIVFNYELKASKIYSMIVNKDLTEFEANNKPIKKQIFNPQANE